VSALKDEIGRIEKERSLILQENKVIEEEIVCLQEHLKERNQSYVGNYVKDKKEIDGKLMEELNKINLLIDKINNNKENEILTKIPNNLNFIN
jgi:hypothetical protein